MLLCFIFFVNYDVVHKYNLFFSTENYEVQGIVSATMKSQDCSQLPTSSHIIQDSGACMFVRIYVLLLYCLRKIMAVIKQKLREHMTIKLKSFLFKRF